MRITIPNVAATSPYSIELGSGTAVTVKLDEELSWTLLGKSATRLATGFPLINPAASVTSGANSDTLYVEPGVKPVESITILANMTGILP